MVKMKDERSGAQEGRGVFEVEAILPAKFLQELHDGVCHLLDFDGVLLRLRDFVLILGECT